MFSATDALNRASVMKFSFLAKVSFVRDGGVFETAYMDGLVHMLYSSCPKHSGRVPKPKVLSRSVQFQGVFVKRNARPVRLRR